MPLLDRAAWGVALLVWLVGVSALSWEIRKPTWLLFSLVLAASRTARPAVLAAASPVARSLRFRRLQEVAIP